MKTCSRCNKTKPFEDFGRESKSKDGLQCRCRECKAEIHQESKSIRNPQIHAAKKIRVAKVRKEVYRYLLKHPCSCGEGDPVVLEFDHNDGVDKTKEISKMVAAGSGWDTILKEIEKCTVRCANCHKRRTGFQFGWWKSTHCLYVKNSEGYSSVIDWPGVNSQDVMATVIIDND